MKGEHKSGKTAICPANNLTSPNCRAAIALTVPMISHCGLLILNSERETSPRGRMAAAVSTYKNSLGGGRRLKNNGNVREDRFKVGEKFEEDVATSALLHGVPKTDRLNFRL